MGAGGDSGGAVCKVSNITRKLSSNCYIPTEGHSISPDVFHRFTARLYVSASEIPFALHPVSQVLP